MHTPGDGRTDDGRLLAGRYRVIRQLGRGGMGVVCSAHDEVLGREVAVKELRAYSDAAPPELADLRLRMQREARAAARVRHTGVIAVHDIAEHEGRPVIVMELVDGPSLDDVMRERGTLDPAEAAGIGARVLEALAAAHRVGVLHRDVKPGNILLERSGRVVLTDFGIAAVEDPGDGAATSLTRSGELVGSLDYLAPERARGEDPGPASDVWALGATLFAAVEGASPFRRTSTWSTLTAIVSEPLPEPRNAGPLEHVLRALMDKDPLRRADAGRAAALLHPVADGSAAGACPAETMQLGVVRGNRPTADHPPTTYAPLPGGGRVPPGPAVHPEDVTVGAAVAEARDTDRGTVRTRSDAPSARRYRAVAASVAAVVLAGAGALWAVNGAGGQEEKPTAAATAPAATERSGPRGHGEVTGDEKAGTRPSEEPAATASSASTPALGPETPGHVSSGPAYPSTPAPDQAPPGDDEADGGGGGGAPAPVCHPDGRGRYDCEVWRTATSYDEAHQPVGQLGSGTNYFFCQEKKPYRETYGDWTNVWWAKTDDDSGNTGVWVSAVYVRGGSNDRPLPGLPTC